MPRTLEEENPQKFNNGFLHMLSEKGSKQSIEMTSSVTVPVPLPVLACTHTNITEGTVTRNLEAINFLPRPKESTRDLLVQNWLLGMLCLCRTILSANQDTYFIALGRLGGRFHAHLPGRAVHRTTLPMPDTAYIAIYYTEYPVGIHVFPMDL